MEAETNKLLAERYIKLEEAESKLQFVIKTIKTEENLLSAEKKEHEKLISDRENEINELSAEKDALQHINKDLLDKNDTILASIDQYTQKISVLEHRKQDMESEVTLISDRKIQITSELGDLESQIEQKRKKMNNDTTRYDDFIQSKEKQLDILNAKLLDSAQKVDLNQKYEETTRRQLATWQKALDERDVNLRIRESKIEMGEDKLIQNSNLMNL